MTETPPAQRANNDSTPRCAQASLDAGEPAFASAPAKTDLWLLLQHNGKWHSKTLDSLDEPARGWIERFMLDHPTARPQLIRRGNHDQPSAPGPEAPKTFFFVRSAEDQPTIWEFSFHDHAELQSIDLAMLAKNPQAMPEHRRHEPLYLVCTHGKRDACCARYGPAVYRALGRDQGDQVWQSSHIGGHRFAATMLCFPHGHCFGRLDEAAARRVAQRYAADQLTDLVRYRGRTTYAEPVQAAEYFLRMATGVYGIDALHYSRGEIAGEERWRVCFVDRESDETHELTIQREVSSELANKSCGKGPEPVHRYLLVSHRQLGTGDAG
ncbi:MAG: hypothetical protein ACI9MR_002528 [Myxococcota bacterium]|jgi:hypothetical protein